MSLSIRNETSTSAGSSFALRWMTCERLWSPKASIPRPRRTPRSGACWRHRRVALITLFQQRNMSTLLHEAGHGWLNEMTRNAERPDAPQQICVFRRKPAGDSDPFQPVIPTEASHRFRCIPATPEGAGGGAVREQSSTDGTVALQ